MSDYRYYVICTGQLKPGVAPGTAISNLVLDIGLEQQKATMLLKKGRVVLKRCDTMADAQRLAEKFDRSGVICFIEDRLALEGVGTQNNNGESSLVRLISKFIPSSSRPPVAGNSRKG